MILKLIIMLILFFNRNEEVASPNHPFTVRSIDTVKYSRDLAREKNNDPAFQTVIESQVKNIAATGANYVAIGTPYDDEFVPYMRLWVTEIRKAGLNVWFRGNFAGWEQWFGYPRIDKKTHAQKLSRFIKTNPDLFADGDIFTPCTECENGALGDPRKTNKVTDFREFLISEYFISEASFSDINKKVKVGYYSMNYDVALLVMDKNTAKMLGNIIVIDHYVQKPEQLISDVQTLFQKTGASIVLGELGVPIPDIHGRMSDQERSKWLYEVLTSLSKEPQVIGLNYWTSVGSSTALWTNDGASSPAVNILSGFYKNTQ